jgi:hypothetical protein
MIKVPILQLSISLALGILLAYPLTSHSMARRMLIGEISRDITRMTPEEKWKPVDCPHLLDLVNDNTIYDPNKHELFARWTTTNPPFFIAMNTWWYDLMRKSKCVKFYPFHITIAQPCPLCRKRAITHVVVPPASSSLLPRTTQ